MFTKIRAAMLAVLVAATMVAAQPGLALAAYTTSCSTHDNYHAYLDKQSVTIRDAIGYAYDLRDVGICTGGSDGASLILPVNLQGGTVGCAVQIGVGRHYAFVSGALRFFITKNDSDCGLKVPIGWPNPVIGHDYKFRIRTTTACSPLNPNWQAVLTDLTLSQSYTACMDNFDDPYATELWAGYEVYNYGDALGGVGTGSNLIQDVKWSSTVGGSKTYLTSTTVYECCGASRSYWHTNGLTVGGHAAIQGYTSSH